MFFDGFAIDVLKSFEKLWKIKWLVEYRSYTPTVRGSRPLPPTRKFQNVPQCFINNVGLHFLNRSSTASCGIGLIPTLLSDRNS